MRRTDHPTLDFGRLFWLEAAIAQVYMALEAWQVSRAQRRAARR